MGQMVFPGTVELTFLNLAIKLMALTHIVAGVIFCFTSVEADLAVSNVGYQLIKHGFVDFF